MTPEQQRIAIAEWCGWSEPSLSSHPCAKHPKTGNWEQVPKYTSDLNALQKAVSKLPDDMITEYLNHLANTCGANVNADFWPAIWKLLNNSTASQRAEALLRTIGKWTETTHQS